jgi:hypothetical protein
VEHGRKVEQRLDIVGLERDCPLVAGRSLGLVPERVKRDPAIVEGGGVTGVCRNGAIAGRNRIRVASELKQRAGALRERLNVVGIAGENAVESDERLGEAVELDERDAAAEQRIRKIASSASAWRPRSMRMLPRLLSASG